MTHKMNRFLPILFIGALVLAACGGGQIGASDAPSGSDGAAATDGAFPEGDIAIELWTKEGDAQLAFVEQLAADYTALHPNVEFTVVPGPVGYGAGPDGGTEPPGVPGATPLGVSDRPDAITESISTRMADFAVTDASGSGQGWSISVSGDKGRGRSPVLRQYCPSSSCSRHAGPGYVRDGISLPPNSLTFDSSGARFHGQSRGSGEPPANTCADVCFIDTPAATPSKIAVASAGAGMGAFKASGFSEQSFRLVAPGEPATLPRGEIYRVGVSWSLNTGP